MQLHRSIASIVDKALADRKLSGLVLHLIALQLACAFFYPPDLASVAAVQGIRYIGAPLKRVHRMIRIGTVKVVRDVEVQEI